MQEIDLNQLEPVDDPTLIATLEQPQSTINKNGLAGDPQQGAYSQSALDAFDRAISTANRLKEHPGFGSAVGSGFDPQSWGSWKLFPKDDDRGTAKEFFAGTSARDFAAELDAMKAQVFLPMVQSMKGMGALSNAEGQKLTDAIGALDIGMGEDAFKASLDRIIGDLTVYRNRGAPKDAQEQGKDAAAPAAPAPTGPGDIGFAGAPPPPENPLNPAQQAAYDAWHQANPQASPEQLVAFVSTLGAGDMSLEDARKIVEARDAGAGVAPGSEAIPGLTPQEQAEVASRVEEASSLDRFSAGVADTATMGLSNKIIAAGRDLTGKGEYDRELLMANAVTDQIADESPWLYHGGQVGAGVVLPTFGARSPAQLAKVAAGYGAAYGAGSSDSLAEVPGNVIAGGAIGAVTGWGGGKLVEKLEQRAARKAAEAGADAAAESAETAATRYARAQEFGIEPGLDAVGGRGSKIVGNTLSNMPGSAQAMNAARQRLAGQVEGAVDDVAGSFGDATSFRGMGEAAQRGSKAWIDKFERVSGKAYEAIPISPRWDATLDNTRVALDELTTIFKSNPKMAQIFRNGRLNAYLEALSEKLPDIEISEKGAMSGVLRTIGRKAEPEPGKLSWEDLKTFRSIIGEQIGEQRFGDAPMKSELRRLYGALSEDMRATAKTNGPKALAAFERANALYRQGEQRIENALKDILGDDSMKSPEAAAAKLQAMVREGKSSADLAKVQGIWRSLPAAERGEVANGLIRLMGRPSNSEGRDFSAQTFIRNFNDMAPAAKNLIFGATGKELRQNLDEFAKVMGNFAERDALRNTSNTASQMLTGFGFYQVGNIPLLLTQAATSYGAARLMTHPPFVKWATGYSKMLRGAAKAGKEPTEANIRTQTRLLDRLIATEPAIAQEATGLREAILRAANDNLSKGAAAEEEASGRKPE